MHRRRIARLFAFALGVAGAHVAANASVAAGASLHILDAFDDLSPWTVGHTDDVSAKLDSVDGKVGKALRLSFDFTDANGNPINGYATARRALPLDLPDNYELSFWVRGDAGVNALQFKLVDASGDNVWWMNRPDFTFPHEWTRIRIRKRQVAFAWGPTKDRELKHSASIEFVVASGRDGGKGQVEFDQLAIRTLPPPDRSPLRPLRVDASSALRDSPATAAADGDPRTAWRSDPATGAAQHFDLDFGKPREFGGLVLHWRADAMPGKVAVELSDDGTNWHAVAAPHARNGSDDALQLTETDARYLRLALDGPGGRGYALNGFTVEDLAWGASPNAFFENVAKAAPRGAYPRGFVEQPYWTIVGVDGGPTPALISEDGALQPGKSGFSIEPFLRVDGRLVSWADVTPAQSLRDGYLPIPSVAWTHDGVQLTVTAFADGSRERSQLIARYEVANRGDAPRSVDLALAIRPFQVNPPWQFLNTPGGVAPIHDLAWRDNGVAVDGALRVLPLDPPADFVVGTIADGSVGTRLQRAFASAGRASGGAGERPGRTATKGGRPRRAPSVHDATGYAAGALVYRFELPAHASRRVALIAPLSGPAETPRAGASADAWAEARLRAVAAAWRAKLNRVRLKLPPPARRIADAVRTAQADMLMSRDGPALRPGTRSYARSWIRDGAMIAEALLRLGDLAPVRAYVDWYAPHQFANGKVPCCVDHRGSDPVPENDSHGELIHAIAELYRYGGDRGELSRNWPHVEAAIGYMDTLRATQTGSVDPAFKGLLPASISHEGYSAKPMHSYWDDFWGLTGYKDAADLAQALGKPDAARLARERDTFAHDIRASIRTATKERGIDFIPGSAELGDFDATSTTIAFSPACAAPRLPQDLLRNTFERYWRNFTARADGSGKWEDYTPYEWRTVSALTRLGERERAQAAIDFFFASGARPPGWNQWAEVVGRELRKPRFIGDMPHAWVASDFVRSTLDLFAYDCEDDHSLVLAAGIPRRWLDGDGVAVEGLRTPYGKLSYSLRREGRQVVLRVAAGIRPPGGFVFAWPGTAATRASIDGRATSWNSEGIRFPAAPATVAVEEGTR